MRTCPACQQSAELEPLWDITIEHWNTCVIRCPSCSLAYINQLPTLQQLEDLYSQEFFKGTSAYADYMAEKEGLQRNFQHRIHTLRRYSSGGKLFEAGCAHGFFMEVAMKYWDVKGSDISKEAIQYARNQLGLEASVGDFETNPPEPNTYDVVAMWDTIEHLYDPVLAVRKSTEALRPNGLLALTTGDLDAVLPRLQKRSWRLFHPSHLYYFSRRSITWLLNQYGLDIVHFSHVGNYRSLRQMAHILTFGTTKPNWRQGLVKKLDKLPFLDISIPINTFDIMFVIARKPA